MPQSSTVKFTYNTYYHDCIAILKIEYTTRTKVFDYFIVSKSMSNDVKKDSKLEILPMIHWEFDREPEIPKVLSSNKAGFDKPVNRLRVVNLG